MSGLVSGVSRDLYDAKYPAQLSTVIEQVRSLRKLSKGVVNELCL